MCPPILSKYMFNILYNVMIRVINCETFDTNDDEYLKIVGGIRGGGGGATFEVSNHSMLSSSKAKRNPQSLPH